MISGADRVIEIGPGAGEDGGEIVFDGTPAELMKASTATSNAFRHTAGASRPRRKRTRTIRLEGATGHNLKGVDLVLPVASLSCVTGVSGSGKSSLVTETLVPAVQDALGLKSVERALPFKRLHGADMLTGVVSVDQSPLGRTSRGNPATYLKVWNVFRTRFSTQPISVERGYKPGFFSFNVQGGRCETCRGEGAETVEMQFLADVSFECPDCQGKGFGPEALEVTYLGKTVSDVLAMTAVQALQHFATDTTIAHALQPLIDVGLGYLRLGQSLNTLSGGEAQRLKLCSALAEAKPGSLIVLDEPTAGLHHRDITPLLKVIEQLVERGDTVVLVEHDMRVAAFCDHIVDLGPGAGPDGGQIVAEGTPESVSDNAASPTATYLKSALGKKPRVNQRSKPRKPTSIDGIRIQGAREHNLRNLSVDVPLNQFVVVTGPSGSGKSTLAFDVLFSEGQRRYLETLSPYARQYMPQLPRPAVDRVVGVPPGVARTALDARRRHPHGRNRHRSLPLFAIALAARAPCIASTATFRSNHALKRS
ncbi:MAG: hypothetical protein R3A47_10645 [Polyangiales bacterium]